MSNRKSLRAARRGVGYKCDDDDDEWWTARCIIHAGRFVSRIVPPLRDSRRACGNHVRPEIPAKSCKAGRRHDIPRRALFKRRNRSVRHFKNIRPHLDRAAPGKIGAILIVDQGAILSGRNAEWKESGRIKMWTAADIFE